MTEIYGEFSWAFILREMNCDMIREISYFALFTASVLLFGYFSTPVLLGGIYGTWFIRLFLEENSDHRGSSIILKYERF